VALASICKIAADPENVRDLQYYDFVEGFYRPVTKLAFKDDIEETRHIII